MKNRQVDIKLNNKHRDEFIKLLTGLDHEFKRKLGKMVAFVARSVANETTSQGGFPHISGFLRGSYDADDSRAMSHLEASSFSDAFYAPYVEFGTGTKVSVPQGWEDYAIQFKGQKKIIGQIPQPYFTQAVEKWRKKYDKAVDNLIKETIE